MWCANSSFWEQLLLQIEHFEKNAPFRYCINPKEFFSQKIDEEKHVESVYVIEKSHKFQICNCHIWFQKDKLRHTK